MYCVRYPASPHAHRYLSVLYPPYYKTSDYRTESFYKKQPFLASNHQPSFISMQHSEPGSELITMGTLFELFGIIYQKKLYQDKVDDAKSSRKMMQLKPVLEYIDSNYGQTITLNELSRIAGMSPKYFCSYFHSIIHRTPIDYLNYYRIERACSELSTSDLTLTEVAYRCGFSDVCYFIKTFKRYKGITPHRYCMNIG